ncbi:hypothetical protein GCM10009679_35100 [Saccharothrix algeriensis]|uniref:Uncharacterized protein n=1 Tax=Catellatospora bangladeshensis TaxID=310355 RepID=A0A8J3JJ15_9ACTN|nr:hypothetical protein Cba03nite_48230 [Catellatospora bangladeshensis]
MDKSRKDRAAVKVTGAVLTVAAVLTTLYTLAAPAIIIKK